MSDEAIRRSVAEKLIAEAVARKMAVQLCGTVDPWPGAPPTLHLFLYDTHGVLLEELRGWGNTAELIAALKPWLGELPFGEKDTLSYASFILEATPEGRVTWGSP